VEKKKRAKPEWVRRLESAGYCASQVLDEAVGEWISGLVQDWMLGRCSTAHMLSCLKETANGLADFLLEEGDYASGNRVKAGGVFDEALNEEVNEKRIRHDLQVASHKIATETSIDAGPIVSDKMRERLMHEDTQGERPTMPTSGELAARNWLKNTVEGRNTLAECVTDSMNTNYDLSGDLIPILLTWIGGSIDDETLLSQLKEELDKIICEVARTWGPD